MKKFSLPLALAFVCLLSISFSGQLFAAHFKRVKGNIYVNTQKVIEKQFKQVALKLNDIIEAKGKGSFCQIVLENGTTFLLRNGRLKLINLKSDHTIIGLFQGTMFTSVTKGKKNSFRVKTKSASLGVRGTKFYVDVDKDSTYLCVCEGKVEFRNKAGRIVLERLEDVKAKITDPLKVSTANKMMLKVSKEGFALMGIDLNVLSDDW